MSLGTESNEIVVLLVVSLMLRCASYVAVSIWERTVEVGTGLGIH